MILILILVAATNQIYSACPPCVKYQNPLPNHLLGFEINSDNCICKHELTRCAIVNPVCPTGKQCVLKNIPTCTFPPCELESAVCEPFTSCPQVTCSNKCDKSGFMRDPNDCQTCVCNKPCDEVTCRADEKCTTMIEIGGGQTATCGKKEPCPPCVPSVNKLPVHVQGIEINSDGCRCSHNLSRCSTINPVCPKGQECVLKPISTCTFTPCKLETAVCVPFTKCPTLSCSMTCPKSGYLKDQNGCDTCSCNEPCQEITCPSDKKCVIVLETGGGKYARCDPKKACPPCVPSVNPLPVHVQGLEINSDGCKCSHNLTRCSIVNPVCPSGKQCVLKTLSRCTFPPCTLQSAVCEPFTGCAPVNCRNLCNNSGYIKDPNGCQTCVCNNPCKEITCSEDQKCVTLIEFGGGQSAKCFSV